jgi:hypothetical protein
VHSGSIRSVCVCCRFSRKKMDSIERILELRSDIKILPMSVKCIAVGIKETTNFHLLLNTY